MDGQADSESTPARGSASGSAGVRPDRTTLAVAALAGLAGLAGSYAAAGFTAGFVAVPVADVLARAMPGAVVTFAIVVLGDLGTLLNLGTALALAALALALSALVGLLADRRLRGPPVERAPGSGLGALVAGALAWLAAVLLTGRPLAALGAALPVAAVVALAVVAGRSSGAVDGSGAPDDPAPGRRGVLVGLAGVGVAGAAAALIGRGGQNDLADADAGVDDGQSDAAGSPLLDRAAELSFDVDGLEPLVSDNFYTVDIATTPPELDRETWTLSVTGAVEEELELDFADLTGRASRETFVTLRCVGESLNGTKMDNALWTVVPVDPLLAEAGVDDGCCVMLRAADDYFEEFPLAALRGSYLAYEMNGEPLPPNHGAPVRALVPGHWGEINVKWLTEIEVLEREAEGYWEKRGWHGTGPVKTVAKLHVINHLDDGRVRIGGHAYAGTRGIERVEVSTDGGETWTDARLSEPLPGEDVWRQWVHEYDPEAEHEVVVRAVDGTGQVQPRERSDPFPSGPSGWVSRTVRP